MAPFAFLKKIPLFADLPDAALFDLCEGVVEVRLQPGQVLFNEGDAGDMAYIIKDGQLEIIKISGERHILLAWRGSGEVIGEMALLESMPRTATVRARTEALLYGISQVKFDQLLNTSSSAARVMMYTVAARLRSTESLLHQSQKMAQLGTLTAGMAHELNNPSAAALRGSEVLYDAVQKLEDSQLALLRFHLHPTQVEHLSNLQELAIQASLKPHTINALERTDLQFDIETWLDDHLVENGWQVAPDLIDIGVTTQDLDEVADVFNAEQIPAVLDAASSAFTINSVLEEIIQGSKQISVIVKAMKNYVYLDQAPIQSVDLHEGLDNTLVILRSKIKKGVQVIRDYDPQVPHIQAFGSELNQAWTNIIDNAIDAMFDLGNPDEASRVKTINPTIQIRTRLDGDWVQIEIEDNGPGIPQEIQDKIFNPFFTTKSIGKGTGLGMNTTRNIITKHGGEIHLHSVTGKTVFQVRLPVKYDHGHAG